MSIFTVPDISGGSGPPSGPAGGDLTGVYPNPVIAPLAVDDAKVAAANKDGGAATPSMRTLGAGALQACAGNDARLSDARTPTGAAGGDLASTYPNPTVALIAARIAASIAALYGDDAGVYGLGRRFDYAASGSPQGANEIQYTRVWIQAGRTITTMRTFITAGSDGVRMIQSGLYDQAVPASDAGVPATRVALTAADTPPAAFTGVRDVALTAAYLVPTTGWYWVAVQANNAAMSFLISDVFRASSQPRREEASGVFTLPAAAGVLTNPQSAALYCSGVE